jgi:hypothetical protein
MQQQPTKVGSVEDPLRDAFLGSTPVEKKEASPAHDALVGALLGGSAGAIGTAIESKMSNDPLRQKVKALEAKERAGGGFLNAMNLAQAKTRLAFGEFGERHPVAATAIGAGMGALTGAGAAPHARELIEAIKG